MRNGTGISRSLIGGVVVAALVGGFIVGIQLGMPAPARGSQSDPPTVGGIELDQEGEVDVAGAPDLIAVVGLGDEIAGYARKADVFPEAMVTETPYFEPAIPLYDQRGEKLTGYLVPDHGVVSVEDFERGDFGPTIPTVTTAGD